MYEISYRNAVWNSRVYILISEKETLFGERYTLPANPGADMLRRLMSRPHNLCHMGAG